ncbi:MAG: hypothetical protein WHS44_08230 [Fimbriimonadales bacterium]|nr:MAG: hypothetical protein KatS3mg018_0474 [Fimbriimonadales bacterium]
MHRASLEEIAGQHTCYAYYGSRKTLKTEVEARAAFLAQQGEIAEEVIQKWYNRKDWDKDSGDFPDFVLVYENTGAIGDGGIIELKDSGETSIASFNSTIPEKRKKLSELSPSVQTAVRWYQERINIPTPDDDVRDCFYIVRTKKGDKNSVRLSIVDGSFFSTIPTQKLLEDLWRQVLQEASLKPNTQCYKKALKCLSSLTRDEIAKVRRVEGASIKPRLRLMAEVEQEGNPHTYTEIGSRTVNLIFQYSETGADGIAEPLVGMFVQDGVVAKVIKPDELEIGGFPVKLRYLQHKRNGRYTVIQAENR